METPHKIMAAATFKTEVGRNPYWVRDEVEPEGRVIVIPNFCNLKSSPIAYLSPLIHFKGRNDEGRVADLSLSQLKIMQGTFHGSVKADLSNVEEIDVENLHILKNNNWGFAATFEECRLLTVAAGHYPGRVSFAQSGVKYVKNLKVSYEPDKLQAFSVKVNLSECELLTCPEEMLNDPAVIMNKEIRKKLLLNVQARKGLKQPTFEL